MAETTKDAERMRRKRAADPAYADRERAKARAMVRLARRYPIEFARLVEDEVMRARLG